MPSLIPTWRDTYNGFHNYTISCQSIQYIFHEGVNCSENDNGFLILLLREYCQVTFLRSYRCHSAPSCKDCVSNVTQLNTIHLKVRRAVFPHFSSGALLRLLTYDWSVAILRRGLSEFYLQNSPLKKSDSYKYTYISRDAP